MIKLKATTLDDIVSVEIISAVPGNSWETGKHDANPNGYPIIVVKGRTYQLRITNKRSGEIWDVPYQVGSGLTYRKSKENHPTVEDIIGSVFCDQEAIEYSFTFEDFCLNFGYVTDSRKALEIYLECQEAYNKFNRFFSYDERSLIEMLDR